MPSAYCNSCKAKITREDVNCPHCGSPTSRLVPIVLCVAIVTACVVLYQSYRQTIKSSTADINDTKYSISTEKSNTTSVGLAEE